ncbi:MAG: Hsp20/alpha crystallin family protein [Planctomycetes bacterium]|nr:Hsp20/alpha crystallin family protein [Planctomycetota bacterium]
MNICRISGVFPVVRMREEMDRLFAGLAETFPEVGPLSVLSGRSVPAVNLWEDDNHLYAEAEVPGLKLDDLEITLMGNELTIKGTREACAAQEGVSYHRRERSCRSFTRVVRLPSDIDAEKVSARLENGVLTVTIPKAETARPRKIEVKTLPA